MRDAPVPKNRPAPAPTRGRARTPPAGAFDGWCYARYRPALADAGIIRRETAQGLESMAGFRNLPVRECARIDRRRVHQFLRTRLAGLRQFAADIALKPS